jgi:hypothetical protein
MCPLPQRVQCGTRVPDRGGLAFGFTGAFAVPRWDGNEQGMFPKAVVRKLYA